MNGHRAEDNIFFGVKNSDTGSPFNLIFMAPSSVSSLSLDYNVYDANARYNVGGIYTGQNGSSFDSLTAWGTEVRKRGCSGCELHSQERSCAFIDTTDYKLEADSACATMSSSGGQVGAYGATDCVGSSCE
jgi:hypothetical protein